MFCSNCGNNISSATNFCAHCGNRVGGATAPPRPTPNPSSSTASKVATVIFAASMVVLIGVALTTAILLMFGGNLFEWEDKNASANTSGARSIAQSLPSYVPTTHQLVNQTFAVSARGYYQFSLNFPRQARVTGTFSASGGKNDIQVFILDEIAYRNFQNGNGGGKQYYNTPGYVTTDNIETTLAPGSYYLIFSNRDALFTDKIVTARLDAEY